MTRGGGTLPADLLAQAVQGMSRPLFLLEQARARR